MNQPALVTQQDINVLPLNLITPLPFGNTRSKRDPVKLEDLKASVAQRGIIQPVLVRPANDHYELVAGYGRFEVCQALGFADIPVHIKQLSDSEALEAQLEENINRENLSIIDECKAVQQLSAFYNGDRQAIADRLSWTIKKVNERVEILKCCEEVLNAVLDGSITVGHALLLAPFSVKLQQGTLKKIISEKWTVTYLRQRASKGQQYLNLAKFDTTECNSCPNNSAAQSGLFGLDDHKAACSRLDCFKEKTSVWLEQRKAELEDEFGTVLLIQQIDESDRNTVDSVTVGEQQFKTGCQACEKRIVLVDDRLGRSTGNTFENQCIDKLCFQKCINALVEDKQQAAMESIAPLVETETAAAATAATATGKANPVTEKAKTNQKTNVNCNVPKKVIDTNKSILRQASATVLTDTTVFQMAMTYAALKRIATGYKAINQELSSPSSFDQTVIAALRLDEASLDSEIKSIIAHLASKESDQSINMTNLMINSLAVVPDAKALAVASWTPTKELLSDYTIGTLSAMCIKAGVDKAMNEVKAGNFAKAEGSGKGKFIDAILATNFDWSKFAPTEYLSLLK